MAYSFRPFRDDDESYLEELIRREVSPGGLQRPEILDDLLPPKESAPHATPRGETIVEDAVPRRDYRDMASRVESPDANGKAPDVLGHDTDRDVFDREARIRQAREAYGADTPAKASTRWEEEFSSGRSRTTDKDVWRAYALSSIFGDKDRALRVREQMKREQAGYDEGLMKARERDVADSSKGRRISRAMAEALAATGLVNPEDAVNLTYDDPLVKNYGNIATAGIKERGQDIGVHKSNLDIEGKLAAIERQGQTQQQIATDNNASRERIADKRGKKAAGAGGGGGALGSDAEGEALMLQQSENISAADAAAIVATGQIPENSALTPQKVEAALATLGLFRRLPAKKKAEQLASILSQERQNIDLPKRTVETSIARAKSDPQYRFKWKDALSNISANVGDAVNAWKAMSEEGKKNFVQLGIGPTASFVKSASMSDADKVHAGKVWTLINEMVKERSGAAVSDAEWGRIANEVGLSANQWDVFNSPDAIKNYIKAARDKVARTISAFDAEIGWESPR